MRAEGQVLGKSILAAGDGDSDYMVDYRLPLASGEVLEASRSVSKHVWQKLRKGGAVQVLYSASDPKRNFPLGGGVTSVGVTTFVSLLGLVSVCFGGALLWGCFKPRPA